MEGRSPILLTAWRASSSIHRVPTRVLRRGHRPGIRARVPEGRERRRPGVPGSERRRRPPRAAFPKPALAVVVRRRRAIARRALRAASAGGRRGPADLRRGGCVRRGVFPAAVGRPRLHAPRARGASRNRTDRGARSILSRRRRQRPPTPPGGRWRAAQPPSHVHRELRRADPRTSLAPISTSARPPRRARLDPRRRRRAACSPSAGNFTASRGIHVPVAPPVVA